MSNEWAFSLDSSVEVLKLVPVTLNCEAGYGPDDFAQEVDDRSDVVKRHAECLVAQIVDDQPGGLSFPSYSFRASPLADGPSPNIKSVSSLLLPAPIC